MDMRIIVLAGVMHLPLLSGCRTVPVPGPVHVHEEPAVQLGTHLLESIRDRDYGVFSRIVGPEIGERVTRDRFRESLDRLLEHYGAIQDFSCLTGLQTPAVGNHVWKVSFRRKGKNGKTIRQDLMFRLITGQDGDRLKVVSFGFL